MSWVGWLLRCCMALSVPHAAAGQAAEQEKLAAVERLIERARYGLVHVTEPVELHWLAARSGGVHMLRSGNDTVTISFVDYEGLKLTVEATGIARNSDVLSLRADRGAPRWKQSAWTSKLLRELEALTSALSMPAPVDEELGEAILGMDLIASGALYKGANEHLKIELEPRRAVVQMERRDELRVGHLLVRNGLPNATERRGDIVRLVYEDETPSWGPMIVDVRAPLALDSAIERLELLGREPSQAVDKGLALRNMLEPALFELARGRLTRGSIAQLFGVELVLENGQYVGADARGWSVSWRELPSEIEIQLQEHEVELELGDLQARYGAPRSASWHKENAYVRFPGPGGTQVVACARGATVSSAVLRISLRAGRANVPRPDGSAALAHELAELSADASGSQLEALRRWPIDVKRDAASLVITPHKGTDFVIGDLERELGLCTRVRREGNRVSVIFDRVATRVQAELRSLAGSSARVERVTVSSLPSKP
jgi:hypothetical protein